MIRAASAALVLFVSLGNDDDQSRAPVRGPGISVHQQIIIRVAPLPRGIPRAGTNRQTVAWQEERGPRCIPIRQILGAAQIGQESVDLVLRDTSRVRARLERRCPAMDYYFGVYVRPNADGMICADRDEIRTRAGGSCAIERFRTLRPREP